MARMSSFSVSVSRIPLSFGSRMKRRIILQVDALISTKRDGKVTEEEERQLDLAILSSANDSSALNTSRSELTTPTTLPPPSTASVPPPPLDLRHNLLNTTSSPTIRGESCVTPIPMGTEWEAVRLYHSYLAEKKQRSEAEKAAQQKREFSDYLSLQVKEREKKKEAEREAERQVAERVKAEYEIYCQQTGEKYSKRENEMKELRETWEEQVSAIKDFALLDFKSFFPPLLLSTLSLCLSLFQRLQN
jgi:DNA repair photolyase